MSDTKTDLNLAGLGADLSGTQGDSRDVSTLIRDLLNRIEQLEEQNLSLRKELDLVIRGAATTGMTPPAPRQPPERPQKKPAPGSRRSILGTTAAPGVAASRARQLEQPLPKPEPVCPQASKLHQLFDSEGHSDEIQTSKRSGRVRSKFRRQFRYFSMARLHAILAGLCMTVGAIAASVAGALAIPILRTAGIAFACIGIIYMLGVGLVAIALRLSFGKPGHEIVELPPSMRRRPGQSMISSIIYAFSKLLHIVTR